MLHFLPGPLHRTLLRVAHAARLWYWRKTRKRVRGCNVIAANPAGEILLVRHSYHARETWMLPGGGLGRDERPEATAARELIEETGCRLDGARHLGSVVLDRSGWTNVIELVVGTTTDLPCPDGREIEEARFFSGQHPARECQPPRARNDRTLDGRSERQFGLKHRRCGARIVFLGLFSFQRR